MKKTVLLLVLLLTITGITYSQKLSQDFTVTNSTPYQVIDAGSKEYVSLDNGFVIMAKMGRGIVTIQKFDVNGMKEVKRNSYKDLPAKAFFQDIIKVKGRIFYIYEAYNKKAKNFKVYSREINGDDATFKEQVELFKTKRKVVGSQKLNLSEASASVFYNKGNRFIVHKSSDESKIMITYRLYPVSKNDAKNYDEIGFQVFDSSMEKIWGHEVKMPYTEKQINNIAYSISSKGKALMLIANLKTLKYESIIIDESGIAKVNDLGLTTTKFVREMFIKENKKGEFICAGYYANGVEFKVDVFANSANASIVFNMNGILLARLNSEGEFIDSKSFDFTEKFIKQNLSKRQKEKVAKREKKGKAGILDLFMLDFKIKENGDIFFIGEVQYVRKEFFGPQQTYVSHYRNIIMTKINIDNELVWMKKLPKNQAGTAGVGQMSFSYIEGQNADYVAFVDNPKNIRLKTTAGVPAAHLDGKGGYLTTYKIDHSTGALEKHTICDLNKLGKYKAYQFKAYRIFKASPQTYMMEVYIKNKKDMLVKFEINK